MNRRPVGVTVLAVLCFVGAVWELGLCAAAAVSASLIRRILEALTPGGVMGPAPLLHLGALLPIYFLAMAVISGLLGWGLWTLRNWSRIILLLLGLFSFVVGGWEFGRGLAHLTVGAILINFFRLAIVALVLWYLWCAPVRAAFQKPAAP